MPKSIWNAEGVTAQNTMLSVADGQMRVAIVVDGGDTLLRNVKAALTAESYLLEQCTLIH